ncbi:hypothetical protein M011DRAFT_458709 [Sporormia fimetaria CBS 119925]|uniref:Uncharacterized protein n=1 Tax=Sporormia fimetaria CBS 119925 TaxID=1340428 RepID=A0A6A6V937_9PLEO|nr:hypothetical protein M011DRAFT_458709 [Sporormia fimetaria CBS 119925]
MGIQRPNAADHLGAHPFTITELLQCRQLGARPAKVPLRLHDPQAIANKSGHLLPLYRMYEYLIRYRSDLFSNEVIQFWNLNYAVKDIPNPADFDEKDKQRLAILCTLTHYLAKVLNEVKTFFTEPHSKDPETVPEWAVYRTHRLSVELTIPNLSYSRKWGYEPGRYCWDLFLEVNIQIQRLPPITDEWVKKGILSLRAMKQAGMPPQSNPGWNGAAPNQQMPNPLPLNNVSNSGQLPAYGIGVPSMGGLQPFGFWPSQLYIPPHQLQTSAPPQEGLLASESRNPHWSTTYRHFPRTSYTAPVGSKQKASGFNLGFRRGGGGGREVTIAPTWRNTLGQLRCMRPHILAMPSHPNSQLDNDATEGLFHGRVATAAATTGGSRDQSVPFSRYISSELSWVSSFQAYFVLLYPKISMIKRFFRNRSGVAANVNAVPVVYVARKPRDIIRLRAQLDRPGYTSQPIVPSAIRHRSTEYLGYYHILFLYRMYEYFMRDRRDEFFKAVAYFRMFNHRTKDIPNPKLLGEQDTEILAILCVLTHYLVELINFINEVKAEEASRGVPMDKWEPTRRPWNALQIPRGEYVEEQVPSWAAFPESYALQSPLYIPSPSMRWKGGNCGNEYPAKLDECCKYFLRVNIRIYPILEDYKDWIRWTAPNYGLPEIARDYQASSNASSQTWVARPPPLSSAAPPPYFPPAHSGMFYVNPIYYEPRHADWTKFPYEFYSQKRRNKGFRVGDLGPALKFESLRGGGGGGGFNFSF